jgi:hypothetical protein
MRGQVGGSVVNDDVFWRRLSSQSRAAGRAVCLAASLNSASGCDSELAGLEDPREERIAWLRKALECIEGAVEGFCAAGIARYLIDALYNAVGCQLELADVTGELDGDRVLALCREGEPLCAAMGDQQRLAFFRGVRVPSPPPQSRRAAHRRGAKTRDSFWTSAR